jgi:MerR family mercuric resistance operon transcriptional regulator
VARDYDAIIDRGTGVTETKISGLSRTRLAKEAGVGVETIRYYERRGLIDSPSKREHAHPLYSANALEQIKFIKRAQRAGFTLKEIATLHSLGSDHCTVTRELAREKLEKLEKQIASFNETVKLLQQLIEQCDINEGPGQCALFEALHDEDQALKLPGIDLD